MNGDPSTVVGHNGIIPIKLDKDDHRSDTRVFADEWLPELITLLDDEKGFEELEDLVGASKVAIFTHDPRLASQVYILNEHMGHWKDGVWWSNSTYCDLPYSSYFSKGVSYGRDKWWDDEYPSIDDSPSTSSETRCEFCYEGLYERDFRAGKCYSCGVCLDCFTYGADCICYTPAYAQRQFQYEADAFGNVHRLPLDYGTMDIPF
jgi:glutamine amidotransferase